MTVVRNATKRPRLINTVVSVKPRSLSLSPLNGADFVSSVVSDRLERKQQVISVFYFKKNVANSWTTLIWNKTGPELKGKPGSLGKARDKKDTCLFLSSVSQGLQFLFFVLNFFLSNLTTLPHRIKTAVPNWFRRRSFAGLNSSIMFGTWVERRLNQA